MTSDLLDVEESAAYCHIKPTTIRAWILSKKVAHIKLGRRVFLRRKDLEELLERSLVPARAAE
jgi:excisionase family DNA binding protein